MSRLPVCLVTWIGIVVVTPSRSTSQDSFPWTAGLARVDVTPSEPVRMSGYGSRNRPSDSVDTPLFVRSLALRHGSGPTHVMISIDTVGVSGQWTKLISARLEQKHRLSREQIAVCATHTHSAPFLPDELSNLFATPISDEEMHAAQRYDQQLRNGVIAAVDQALSNMQPVQLSYGIGEASFAANRRVLNNGKWSAFGTQDDGPVDHTVPVLRIADRNDQTIGVVFNYACHCTTLGGEHYGINGDWAGYATRQLDALSDGCIALCTIGCGADANPKPRGSMEIATLHGRALAAAVRNVLDEPMSPVVSPIESHLGYAGLAFDLPSQAQLAERAQDKSPQVCENAKHLQAIWEEHGRLPATYPVPIQVWKFGDELTMVLLGGEVVVDYSLRLKRELKNDRLWVTAYANDVLGYICSERMRTEGGYEYDSSAVYYNLPGPWASGTEDLFVKRINEVIAGLGDSRPLGPNDSWRSIQVPTGMELQLIASEPLVMDPINLAFGTDGKVWVVEMGDYPLSGDSAKAHSRIKTLADTDGDGVFDSATVFLDDVDFPTGVQPWMDGVIVSAAPETFFARDTNGDGRCDVREPLFTGFPLANPQHRISGFSYGLEHAFHLSSGDNLGMIRSVRTNETVNAAGRDVRIWPASGKLDLVSGRTQFIRSRNTSGEWFGNDNSRPMYHYVLEDRYLARNPGVRFSENIQYLFDPPTAPPVFPRSNTIDRFNDLWAANRFTSACSSIVFRSPALGKDLSGAAVICEPVHNLVHVSQMIPNGSTYRCERSEEMKTSEWIASTDPWFRPVRAVEGPDGMLWIVDMYRQTIEHPEWIPIAWQDQLDLRAGDDLGRIYRLVPLRSKTRNIQPQSLESIPTVMLAQQLESDLGAYRDLVQQSLLCRTDATTAIEPLKQLAKVSQLAETRIHALWSLETLAGLDQATIQAALTSQDVGLLRNAIQLAESRLDESPALIDALKPLARHADLRVTIQLALSLGESSNEKAGKILGELVERATSDEWLRRALVSSSRHHVAQLLPVACDSWLVDSGNSSKLKLIGELVRTAAHFGSDVEPIIESTLLKVADDDMQAFAITDQWLQSRSISKTKSAKLVNAIRRVHQRALSTVTNRKADETERLAAMRLFARGIQPQDEQRVLTELLSPRETNVMQLATTENLFSLNRDHAMKTIVSVWPSLSQSIRERAIGLALTRTETVTQLLNSLEQGTIVPIDLNVAVKQQLRTTGDDKNRELAEKLLGDQSTMNRTALVQQYLSSFQPAGDIGNGERLYVKHCSACHTPDATGRLVGPNLINLTDRTPRALIESILDPNRSADPQYRSYVVLLEDGRTLAGVISEESGDSITLVGHDARRTTIPRDEIESLRNTGLSLMPEGIQDEMDPASMSDLIRFLQVGTLR